MKEKTGLTKIHLGLAKREQFLQENSVPACMKRYGTVRDVAKCLPGVCDAPSLAKLKKEYSTDIVHAYIEMWILNLNEYLNLKDSMSPNQMMETAILIYQDFYYFNLADINLIFGNAKKGYYGHHYQRLDGATIILWFYKHAEERANIAESICIGEYERIDPQISSRISNKIKDVERRMILKIKNERDEC